MCFSGPCLKIIKMDVDFHMKITLKKVLEIRDRDKKLKQQGFRGRKMASLKDAHFFFDPSPLPFSLSFSALTFGVEKQGGIRLTRLTSLKDERFPFVRHQSHF